MDNDVDVIEALEEYFEALEVAIKMINEECKRLGIIEEDINSPDLDYLDD